MKSILSLLLSFSLLTPSFAKTVTVSSTGVNARSSSNFGSRSNIIATIPEGTEGVVIERRKLPSKNYGIKIRITRLGTAVHTNLKVGSEVWVYYHRKKSDRFVELYNDQDEVVSDPEKSTKSKALKSFRIANKNDSKTAPGESCTNNGAVDAGTKGAVSEQIDCLNKFAESEIPQVNPGTEEILTYIQSVTDHDGNGKNDNPQTQRRLAASITAACAQYNVPTLLVLAMMKQESEFVATAHNSKSGAAGPLQLMRATANELAGGKSVDRFNVETNVRLGVKYISQLMKQNNGDVEKTLFAYNAGPGSLRSYLKGKKRMPKETRKYIAKIKGYIQDYDDVVASTGLTFDN
jgi:hypothetical protein